MFIRAQPPTTTLYEPVSLERAIRDSFEATYPWSVDGKYPPTGPPLVQTQPGMSIPVLTIAFLSPSASLVWASDSTRETRWGWGFATEIVFSGY